MSLLHPTTLQSDARHHPPWLRALQNCDDGDDDDNDDEDDDDDEDYDNDYADGVERLWTLIVQDCDYRNHLPWL